MYIITVSQLLLERNKHVMVLIYSICITTFIMIKVGLHLTTDGLTAINMRHFPMSDSFIVILELNIYLCLKPL